MIVSVPSNFCPQTIVYRPYDNSPIFNPKLFTSSSVKRCWQSSALAQSAVFCAAHCRRCRCSLGQCAAPFPARCAPFQRYQVRPSDITELPSANTVSAYLTALYSDFTVKNSACQCQNYTGRHCFFPIGMRKFIMFRLSLGSNSLEVNKIARSNLERERKINHSVSFIAVPFLSREEVLIKSGGCHCITRLVVSTRHCIAPLHGNRKMLQLCGLKHRTSRRVVFRCSLTLMRDAFSVLSR